jgi:signal transduction histidine kinase
MFENKYKHSMDGQGSKPKSENIKDFLEADLEQNEIKTALLKRPRFSVKARLIIIFLTFFLLIAATSISAMYMISRINIRLQYVIITEKFSNEIHEIRRAEKNYFLYNSDISNILFHFRKADTLLNQAAKEFGHVISKNEIKEIQEDLFKYRELVKVLIKQENNEDFKNSVQFNTIEASLRNYGSKILDITFSISQKERQLIEDTISRAGRIEIIILILLLPVSMLVALHITKHIIARLNRLMDVTTKFAAGDFSPIMPQRKYMDEFTHLAIALNNMMYEIEKRQRLLTESHKLRAIGDLTAGIAHELNNPLNNIILTAELLKEDYNELSQEECEDMINDLVTQGERAHQIVKNLLDFARESEAQVNQINIDKLIDEVIQLARNQIKLRKIKLEIKIDSDLQPINGDRNLLIQVFLNLVLNAIDAMDEGGRLTISALKEERAGFISLHIADTGCGIPEHHLHSIFNPFFTTKPSSKGTGLGLSVSKGIIEKHGGSIEVESRLNAGTTFTVHLPIVSIPADIKKIKKTETNL